MTLREALDCLDEAHFERARVLATSRTPEPRTIAESEALFETARQELAARGHPVATQHEVLHWLADGVEATRRGEKYFDVDAGPGTSRLFWCGPTLDPATGDPVPLGSGHLSNMQLAELLAAETPNTVLLESTTDGGTIERMQLWSGISPDHIRSLRNEDPELDAKIAAFEAELPGDGYAFQRVVWQSMAAQYARDAAAAAEVNPELEIGVVTQQPWAATDFYGVEYQQLAGRESQIWYTAQVRTPGGIHDPTPGPVSDREMNAAGRGWANLPPPANPYPTLHPELARLRATLDGSAPAHEAVRTTPGPGSGSQRTGHSMPPLDRSLDR